MLLKELSEAVGVSGDEGRVRQIVLEAIRPHVDEVRVDTLGNVLAVKRGREPDGLRVMAAAHMDEVGLMITGFDGDGTLIFRAVGGIDPRILLGKVVQIGVDRLPGVIGARPVHLLRGNDAEAVVKIESLRIDIGAKDQEQARNRIKLGDYATFVTNYVELGPTARGKAFDDRAGCAVLIALLQGDPFLFDLHAAFTVQEEVGLRGATVAAFAIHPDVAFVLEATVCEDRRLPDENERESSPVTEVGKGPAISLIDRSSIYDRRLIDLLTGTGDALGIPYQFKQAAVGGNDAGAIHLTAEGVPAAALSIPARYIHSPAAIISLDDFTNTVRLVRESLMRLTPEILERKNR